MLDSKGGVLERASVLGGRDVGRSAGGAGGHADTQSWGESGYVCPACDKYNDFDIILAHFSRICQRCTIPPALCGVLYLAILRV